QWLAALTRPNGTIDADPDALEDLRQQLDEWTRSLETTGEQGVRLCLRLWVPEPEPESHPDAEDTQVSTGDVGAVSPNGWELELLLQAADDPSLLVEASTVWKSTEATMEVLERHLDRPQETLLEELGRAASLYPALESDSTKPRRRHSNSLPPRPTNSSERKPKCSNRPALASSCQHGGTNPNAGLAHSLPLSPRSRPANRQSGASVS